jgi:HNH endonuclease
METCPYSQLPYGEFTDDHIFPRFLGGSRTIRVCRQCNNTFGHTFEGRASNQLKRLQVFISDFGLDLTRTTATWPAAIVIDEIAYDLQSGPEGAQYVLHKPTFIKDSEGNILGGKARSLSEARQITSGLKNAGKIKDAEILYDEDKPFEGVNLTSALTFNDDLYRLATKMAGAALVAFDRAHVVAESGIPAYLHGAASIPVSPAYCDIEPIRKLRPPLSHAVYVELGRVSYAIVLIFGFLKIYVPLPYAKEAVAFLGSLDPMSGDESFQVVKPVGARTVPQYLFEPPLAHFQEMCDALSREALARGAKRPPKLELKQLVLGPPVGLSTLNGTIRYMFPLKREH